MGDVSDVSEVSEGGRAAASRSRACVAAALSLLAMMPAGGRADPAPSYDFVAFLPDPTADASYLEMLDSFEAYATYMRSRGVENLLRRQCIVGGRFGIHDVRIAESRM